VKARATLDVSHLPTSAFDERSPLWWGNLLLVLIETTTLAIMLASYFYLRMNFEQWPPPKVDVHPPIHEPWPDLGAATAAVVLMLAACLPMYWTDMAARRQERGKVLLGLGLMLAVSVAAVVLRGYEFHATKVWWNDNAYASVVWTTLGVALTYQLAAAGEFLIMLLWIATNKLDEKHALDVTLAGGFWYWVAGTGAVVYAVIFWGARVL
jgi:heme/copper-type cytochrome/quinol oxidase subunit 3